MTKVEWSFVDQETLGRVSKLRIRGKSLWTPTRAASVSEGFTSEEKIVAEYAREKHPLRDLCIAYRGINHTTIQNIKRSNGKFNNLKRAVQRILDATPDSSMRMLYLRIPKISKIHGTEIQMEHLSVREAEALFDFVTQFDSDIIVLPIPPMIQEIDMFKRIVDTYYESRETFNVSEPFMGYIPNVDDPLLAGEMASYYLKKGIRLFGIDFGGGHPRRTIATVVRVLRGYKEEYYLHAFNVHPSKPSERDITNIMDLLVHTYGFDSFSNVGWGGGGGDLTESELRERVRYPVIENYGAYRYSALKKYLKDKGVSDSDCRCPICKNESIEGLYENNTASQLRFKVKVHRIFADSGELENIRTRITEQKYMPYLDGKSNLRNPLNQIRKDIRDISRQEMTMHDFRD